MPRKLQGCLGAPPSLFLVFKKDPLQSARVNEQSLKAWQAPGLTQCAPLLTEHTISFQQQ
eukprot:1142493-Pelagomonas_calceolata.AAC.3